MSGRLQQQPNIGHYALLALIPPAAGLLVWRASEHLAGHGYGWVIIGGGVLIGVATAAVWARRIRTSVSASLVATGFVVEFIGELIRKDGPADAIGFAEGLLAGGLLVCEVVLALWLHGNYRLEVGHRVRVWLLEGETGDDPEYYQAICECTWHSERFAMEVGDDSEERAFAAAHGHSPTVRTDIAMRH
ncbi:hypothetical protein ACFO1B_24480 [Dactylosporangium siamense]|uniref:Uncharacterized protein n=1 Tax=Dactylosporangium siamense TaxID=685454 RepID=A0A919UDD4_9ACTN|nr:hypothetical protein [Dactylosporangium siamense]GIG47545.1 hypothetical protein Dsi01nite_055860 [Dactylosporangium siamense]